MKKIIIIILLLFASESYSQEIKYLKELSELDNIVKSNKGNVILFNFWATWCRPCVEEFPDLMKLYNNYKEKNLKVSKKH